MMSLKEVPGTTEPLCGHRGENIDRRLDNYIMVKTYDYYVATE